MNQPPPKRTMFAQQAVDFSDYFDMMFEKLPVGGECQRIAKLAAPEGISTGGGKQALQHILLTPQVPGMTNLTVGWVDRGKGVAQLRTYDNLAAQHQQRFPGQPFLVDQASYDALFAKAQGFFQTEGIPVKVESAAAAPQAARVPKKTGVSPLVWVGVALLAVVVLFVLVGVAGAIWYYSRF